MVSSQDTDLQIFLSQAFLLSTWHPHSNNSRARLYHELKEKGDLFRLVSVLLTEIVRSFLLFTLERFPYGKHALAQS